MCWNDEGKAAFEKKETDCKEVLGARDETAKERCMEVYKKEKEVKRCIYQEKWGKWTVWKEYELRFERK